MSNPPRPQDGAASAWRWAIPALLLLVPAFGWPLFVLGTFALDAGAVTEVVREPAIWQRLGVSTGQALLSTALSLALGLPVAWMLSQFRFPGHAAVRLLVLLPVVLPTIVVALAVQQLLGPAGWLNAALDRLDRVPVQAVGTLWAILAAHAIFGVAIVAWVVTGAWARLDRRQVEAARMLGATPAQAFRHLTLPALAPAVGSAATLVFVFAFTSFAVVLLLGAPRLDTIEVTIYRLSTRPDLWSAAAVLALVQLLMTVAAFATRAPLHNAGHGPIEAEVRPLRSASAGERAGVALVLLVVAALVLLPLVGLIAGAFVLDGAFTTRHFAALLTAPPDAVAPAEALTWSVAFASLATLIALPAGAAAAIATARARGASRIVLGLIVWAPVAVPAVALAFAYTTMANNELIDLRGSPVLVLAAHALIAYPFVVRAVRPAAHGLAPHLEEAATVLGAAPGTAWRRLGLPMLRRALVVGAAFAFIVSFGEFGATLLLRRPEFTTAPVAVFDALSRPGSAGAGVAGALATVLIAVAVVAFVVIDRFRRHDSAEV